MIDKYRDIRISYRLYIDDLKIYASNSEQQRRQLEIIAAFSDAIRMEMEVDKCATLEVKRGKLQAARSTTLMNHNTISALNEDESYKYLGIHQAVEINTSEMKDAFREKFYKRVKLLLKSGLNSKSLFTAINIWAIPSLSYSFGILTWSQTDLREIDKRIRSLLTRNGMHHPHSSTIRLYLPRKNGGRGLLNLETTHSHEINTIKTYFMQLHSPVSLAVREADEHSSTLKLPNPEYVATTQSLHATME